MLIKGLQKLTLLDFPGEIACTVFLGGCNFRCPFCHNASLVVPEKFGETLPEEEFFDFLLSRQGKLHGVCISGGEPTVQGGLEEFIRKIRELGYLVKLDTNGYRPEVLKSLVEKGLLDYVAMDIKNSREKYAETAGISHLDVKKIEESAEFLMKSGIPFEFRTTVMKEFHTKEDFVSIGKWLMGEESFFLQSYKDSGDILSGDFTAYSDSEMTEFLTVLQRYIPRAKLR